MPEMHAANCSEFKLHPLPPAPIGEQPNSAHVGARFESAVEALDFMALIAGAGVAGEADCRRFPDGGGWWVQTLARLPAAAAFARMRGGELYRWKDRAWRQVWPEMLVSADKRPEGAVLSPPGGGTVSLPELLGFLTLRSRQPEPSDLLEIVLPVPLARGMLRRTLRMDVEAKLTMLEARAERSAPSGSLVLLTLRRRKGHFTRSYTDSLRRLPFVMACQRIGASEAGSKGSLLFELGVMPPLSADCVSSFVPSDEIWAVGPLALGSWLLRKNGPAMDAASFLTSPPQPTFSPALQAKLPQLPLVPIELHLRHRPKHGQRIEACLLDDTQLPWLAHYAIGRELSEKAYLAPGPGWHLLFAPGGLSEAVPFGQPLWCAGPGALYLPFAYGFDPPLPLAARAKYYPPNENAAYTVTRSGAFVFDLDNAVPVWSSWMGAAPKVQSGLSQEAKKLLALIPAELRNAVVERQPQRGGLHTVADPSILRDLATKFETSGQPEQAAACMEELGDFAAAARLLERAAERRRDD